MWTVLDSHGGWEWEIRRRAQFHVSRVLNISGLLLYVFDGDYWFYELFANGEVGISSSRTPWKPAIGSRNGTAPGTRSG
jgi:hypothetical protein